MWTNVFKIGGFHHLSWFQLLPQESDLNPPPDKSLKVEQNDATLVVLSSHLQLQKEGFFSTWTNSFVGPWDPSQGLHNPDEKIKLWLFLPGHHSTIVDAAQAAISKLKVFASGLWSAPGDSEEVAAALAQALRNRIERSMIELSYMRFGDVFSKYRSYSQSEELVRRGQPMIEFVFAASEEAVFVHVIICAKHIRSLSSGDIEKLSNHSYNFVEKLPVVVSPHGMRGKLTGCCPSDLVNQVYFSSGKFKTSNGVIGLPFQVPQLSAACQLKGQNCYAEVTLGCLTAGSEKPLNSNSLKNFQNHQISENQTMGKVDNKGSLDQFSISEKIFIYPVEALLIPVLQMPSAKYTLKRFWLQNWMGPSLSGSSFFMPCSNFTTADKMDAMNCVEPNGARTQRGYNSSSNSNSSSISSISSSSGDSDYMITAAGDLEADADSLTCRQSDNNFPKLGNKRPRTGTNEAYGQVINVPAQDTYKSDFGCIAVNNSDITGVENEQIGNHWDLDGDDRGIGMDIQALLSEFGDFGDFFENDDLPFGEPPGTAESQALMYSAPDFGEGGSSPCTGVMDVSDQMFLPVGFSSFESFNPPVPIPAEECISKTQEGSSNVLSVGPVNCTTASSMGEFDHLIKAEALMTFAPEYGAVETPTSELSSSIFRSPYLPKSRKLESPSSSTNSYVYGATPPSSPCLDKSNEKPSMQLNSKLLPGRHDGSISEVKKYYTCLENKKEQNENQYDHSVVSSELVGTSPFTGFSSLNTVKSAYRKTIDGSYGVGRFLLSMKTVLATEIECIWFQASMCRIRHTLLSTNSPSSIGLGRLTGSSVFNNLPGEPSSLTDNMASKYEVKKKESISVRIAGDIDGGMQDPLLNAPVGVWRSVGGPKIVKHTNSPSIDSCPPLMHNSFNDEVMLSYGQRQPLQELLDGLALLVQQATSSVDVSLDADYNDGIYGWLALQEQWRRGFSCGPSTVHAGCGGSLASCHSLDISGVELADPLSADILASSVISLVQSDIKTALKAAFSSMEGPLSVIDWCKSRSQSYDALTGGDGYLGDSAISESRDSSSIATPSLGDPISPSQTSAGGSSCSKDGVRVDEVCHCQQQGSRSRPTLLVLPLPAILVGYQDDWLKTSASSLQNWEKAPFEPYALQKPMTYCVICPDIDPLSYAAADFFQQLGTVYETCNLGAHSPQSFGNQMEVESGKSSSSGFVLLDCPQSMKIESRNASLVGLISDYFLSLSNGWDLTSFLKSLSRTLKALKLGSWLTANPKEGSSPCLVIYVVCPFPEPTAILQTVIESSVAIGSSILSSDKDRRSVMHNQVAKALSCSASVDEASISNILPLLGFSIPKLVLQIITVDAIFRVTSPALNELVLLKEIAFTVYNKARRISRGSSNGVMQSASFTGKSHSMLMQMPSSLGMWKDCVGSRLTGSSVQREGELDTNSRPVSWDNSWQTPRAGGLGCDPNRTGEFLFQEETCYLFEPLFVLSESGSVEHGVSPTFLGTSASEPSKVLSDESTGFMQSASSVGCVDTGPGSQLEGSESDGFGYGHRKDPPSLHCCYGWTEDWRWLVCIWTDSRGEMLDSHIFPFGGISSRQDTKGMQCLFVQVLEQGCQIIETCSSDSGIARPRDFVITRIGCYYELECQEWQKAIYTVGGSDVKKWPVQLRRSVPDGMSVSGNGTSLQQQDMGLIQDRTLPSSPSSLYSSQGKASGFIKGSLGQSVARSQLMGGHAAVDNSRGLLQWVQSISLVTVSIDHSLQLVFQADSSSSGGTQVGSMMGLSGYQDGFTAVKSLGSTSASYILIPSPSMHFLPQMPLQLPTCLTAESPPLAHLLHSKGSAIPFSTGFLVSKAVPSMRKDTRSNLKEEWPSVLSVSLVDYYGGNNKTQDKKARGMVKLGARSLGSESKDFEMETHLVLESVAAELHALSWMTVSPAYLERRTALPFHCDMVLRLRRLLHFADKGLSQLVDKL